MGQLTVENEMRARRPKNTVVCNVIDAATKEALQDHYEVMIPMSWLFPEPKPRYSYHSCGPVYPERTPRSPRQRTCELQSQ